MLVMICFGAGTDGTLPVSSTSEFLTKKKLVSCHKKACVAEQSITNFSGDRGEQGEDSHSEKRRVDGHRVVKTPKELVSCHINASIPDTRSAWKEIKRVGWEGSA